MMFSRREVLATSIGLSGIDLIPEDISTKEINNTKLLETNVGFNIIDGAEHEPLYFEVDNLSNYMIENSRVIIPPHFPTEKLSRLKESNVVQSNGRILNDGEITRNSWKLVPIAINERLGDMRTIRVGHSYRDIFKNEKINVSELKSSAVIKYRGESATIPQGEKVVIGGESYEVEVETVHINENGSHVRRFEPMTVESYGVFKYHGKMKIDQIEINNS